MNNLLKASITFFLPLAFLGCSKTANKIETKVKEVSDPTFGNIAFNLTQKDFEEKGFNYDDLMKFTIHDYNNQGDDLSFEAAFVKNYNEVGYFAPCLCNYGGTNESPEISFGIMPQKDNADSLLDKSVTIEMVKKQGYRATRELVNVATKLTYEELGRDNLAFANFRDVTDVGSIAEYIKAGQLYRGSSPFNSKNNPDNRDYVADVYLGVEEIENEISLADTDAKIEEYMSSISSKRPNSNTLRLYNESKGKEGANKSFFSVCLASDYYTTSIPNKNGNLVKQVFEYFADRSSKDYESFYFHCNEGKDRTGFFAMVLEALMGVPLEDLVADAMLTFKNYYNVSIVNNKEKYDALANLLIYRHIYSILIDNPSEQLGKINWYNFNAKEEVENIISNNQDSLKDKAEKYLLNVLGVEEEKIQAIQDWLKPDNALIFN
ncbi:MAG: tyrosine-protein phosphatase [Bacilli bacterium]|nr:tyrosine-protein phosphatase [Bacilli bacterium]